MGTKLTELHDGCFHRALDDEPMFVLLARDTSAPILVRTWAEQRRHDIERGRRPASDMAQVLEAEQSATRMEAWREANDGKWRTGLFSTDPHIEAVMRADAAEHVGEARDTDDPMPPDGSL